MQNNRPIASHTLPTLDRFVKNRRNEFANTITSLSQLFHDIALAGKMVHSLINKAGLLNVTGALGSYNAYGDAQQKLDIMAHDYFMQALKDGGEVCAMISEEAEDIIDLDNPQGNYVVAIDPLDGSFNIDVNISIGTIFSIYQRVSPSGGSVQPQDVLQSGSQQVAAGYILYGTSMMFVYTTGHGVHGFTYDPGVGDFFLSHQDIKMPQDGKLYSVNDSYFDIFPNGVKNYIQHCRASGFVARYIGAVVADVHRNLFKGGIYLYPPTQKTPKGKIRLMFESNPLAFIVEQAGGVARDAHQRILDIVPTQFNAKTALYIGSAHMVKQLMAS